jgi:hypothetical protein
LFELQGILAINLFEMPRRQYGAAIPSLTTAIIYGGARISLSGAIALGRREKLS